MKKILISAFAYMAAAMGFAQSNDPIIMTINGKQITRSEFEYSYNKNNSDGVIDKKSVEDYVPLFVNFKLKVLAAEDAKFDTLTSVKNDLMSYREQMLLPTVVDSSYIEREAYSQYKRYVDRYAGEDVLTASHILVLMRQDATPEQQKVAKERIDSIYRALNNGADFAELAKKCSDDKGSAARGGSLGQFVKGQMIPEFENAAFKLQAGQVSAPFKSSVGWHIIKMIDRHQIQIQSYDYYHNDILKNLKARGIQKISANHYIDSLANKEGVSRQVIIDREFDKLIARDMDQKYLSQEYYDGTLMYEIVKTTIWDVAAQDEAGIAQYFAKNKKKYKWDSPRFKGILIRAKQPGIIEGAKQLIKKEKDDNKWGQMIVDKYNTDSLIVVRIEHGIYKQGDSNNVDILQFGKDGEIKKQGGFDYVDTYGRMISKPETYKDVRAQVVSDYQSVKEQEWVEQLRAKYPVSVDKSVLKTVNNH